MKNDKTKLSTGEEFQILFVIVCLPGMNGKLEIGYSTISQFI